MPRAVLAWMSLLIFAAPAVAGTVVVEGFTATDPRTCGFSAPLPTASGIGLVLLSLLLFGRTYLGCSRR